MKKSASSVAFMNKVDYSGFDRKFSKYDSDTEKPTVLLHACCGPCSTSCVERLISDYSVTLYYYNPNITDEDEYLLRRETLLQFINAYNAEHKDEFSINFLEGPYDTEKFLRKTESLREEPEGGKRCDVCFALRLTETAHKAEELGFDYFSTTMSVSPHKNYDKIKTLGLILEDEVNSSFLDIDFKKNNGFGRSVEMSKEYGLYRQNFCGCEFAREAMKNE